MFSGGRFFCVGASILFVCVCLADAEKSCIVKGRIYTQQKWHGYIVQKTFQSQAKIKYQISYPVSECCASLLIYYDDQIEKLTPDMSCSDRQNALHKTGTDGVQVRKNNAQVIPLYNTGESTCNKDEASDDDETLYICKGERTLKSNGPRTWYVAISRCDGTGPLNLNYFFNLTGFYGPCEVDALDDTVVPPRIKDDTYMYVSLALGIIAGIAIAVCFVFAFLWFQTKRHSKKGESNSSVSSSEPRTTPDTQIRDIFYVNPSLSDREQTTDYSGSAGSENYYEVIPERRSYESVNPHLQIPGHPMNRHVNHNHLKEHQRQLQTYVFSDYPPPPYQPPHALAAGSTELQSNPSNPFQNQQHPSSGTFHRGTVGHSHLSPFRPPLNNISGQHQLSPNHTSNQTLQTLAQSLSNGILQPQSPSQTQTPIGTLIRPLQNCVIPGTSNRNSMGSSQLNTRVPQLETSLC